MLNIRLLAAFSREQERRGCELAYANWNLKPVLLLYLARQNDWMIWGKGYASYSCISSLFTSIFHVFAAYSIRCLLFFCHSLPFALFLFPVHRSFAFICHFRLISPPIFLAETAVSTARPCLLVLWKYHFGIYCFNHTNNVFELH